MATSLDETAVLHVAHLARIDVTDEEVVRFAEQLSSILNYVEQLNEPDTTGIPPMAHALPVTNVFRDDTVRPCWEPNRALHNAPQRQEDFFRVPRVLGQEGT